MYCKGEFDYTIIENYYNYIIVDMDIEGSYIFHKWKKVWWFVINRWTKRVYGFISQQIAEIMPEAVSVQKVTL